MFLFIASGRSQATFKPPTSRSVSLAVDGQGLETGSVCILCTLVNSSICVRKRL